MVHKLSDQAVHKLSGRAVHKLRGQAVCKLSSQAVSKLTAQTAHELSRNPVVNPILKGRLTWYMVALYTTPIGEFVIKRAVEQLI